MPSQRFSSGNFPAQIFWFWRFDLASLPHRDFADAVAVLSPTEGIHEAGIEGIVAICYSHPIARTPVLCGSYIAPIAHEAKVWPIRWVKSSGRCVPGEGATARGIRRFVFLRFGFTFSEISGEEVAGFQCVLIQLL